MKKKKFIDKVLKSKLNTVFTTRDQVENALELFEKYGMIPPPKDGNIELVELDSGEGFVIPIWEWE